jgi:copper chaperone CopZ
MTCDACGAAVREVLELPGVNGANISLDTGVVDVDHTQSVSVEMMVGAVLDTGYEVGETRSS